ncbi:MAG: molybdenum cofactor biosynthesis protein MoaE [Vulcanimicrobiaceae bacterium]
MRIAIATARLDPRRIEDGVRAPGYGGIVTVLGTVRERTEEGREITALHYETYESMALAEMERIAREVSERFGDVRLAMVHRVGDVPAGDVAVVVSVAAVHRREAFAACSFAIDALKARAEIWKQERYRDGEARWIANDCGPGGESDAACR